MIPASLAVPRRCVAACCVAMILAVIAVAPGALAATPQPRIADGDRVWTVEAVFASLSEAYRDRRPFVEAVRVTAGAGDLGKTGEVRVWTDKDERIAIELGPFLVNAIGGRVLMAHLLDTQTYAEVVDLDAASRGAVDADDRAADGVRALAALRASLPPLNLLALEFAYGDAVARGVSMPFAQGVVWEGVSREGGELVLSGRFRDGSIELRTSRGADRVRSVRLVSDEGDRRLVFQHRLIDGEEAREAARWLIDTDRRTAVPSPADLGPRPGDVRAGVPLPDLSYQDPGALLGLTPREPPPVPMPGALVVFGEEAATVGSIAVESLAERGVQVLPLAVVRVDTDGAPVQDRLRSAFETMGRRSIVFSIEPALTLRRFSARANCAVVAIDGAGVVAGVWELDADATDELARRAAARAAEAVEAAPKSTEHGSGTGS